MAASAPPTRSAATPRVSVEALSGTNTYTGVTTVDAGAALFLTGTGSIASSSKVDATSGTFDISTTANGASFMTLAGTNSAASAWYLGAQTLTITNGNTTFAGVIGGLGGSILTGGTQTLGRGQRLHRGHHHQ